MTDDPRTVSDAIKVAVCEYLLEVNRGYDRPFVPPTAIDWLGNGITTAVVAALAATEGAVEETTL